MFPKIEANLQELNEKLKENEEIKSLGKSYLFDYEKGEHIIVDGRLVECSSDETVIQWIEKVLRTELGKYKVYTTDETIDFGISIYQYIGLKKLPAGYLFSELKREITEQLLQHRFIKSVEDYTNVREKRGVHINFTCVLVNGNKLQKDVIISEF